MVTRSTKTAKDCLAEWGTEIRVAQAAGETMDQPALHKTRCKNDGVIGILPHGWENGLFAWPDMESLRNRKKAVFIHFTNTGRMMARPRFGGQKLKADIRKYFIDV